MARYGLYGALSRDFLTSGGLVLVHSDRGELEFLFPGATVREVPPSIPPEQCLPVRFHPELASVQWPLKRSDFR